MCRRKTITLSVCAGAVVLAALNFYWRKAPAPSAVPEKAPSRNVAGISGDNVPRIARVAGFKSGFSDSTNHFREWMENSSEIPVLRPEQLAGYLAANQRNAASLLGAFHATRDAQFLKEAEQNFPNDPRVELAAAFAKGISPAERRDWLEKLKQNDPDNSMGNYLAARDDLQNGQSAAALQEMSAAAGKSVPQSYRQDFAQNTREAYLAAGYSEIDAKIAASETGPDPELIQFKQLAKGLGQIAATAQSSGDSAGSQAALQMTMNLGGQLDNNQNSDFVTALVGQAIEYIALEQMDPNAPYGGGSQTAQNQMDRLKQEKMESRYLIIQEQSIFPAMSDADTESFLDRRQLFGEMPALRWAVAKYGSTAATNP